MRVVVVSFSAHCETLLSAPSLPVNNKLKQILEVCLITRLCFIVVYFSSFLPIFPGPLPFSPRFPLPVPCPFHSPALTILSSPPP